MSTLTNILRTASPECFKVPVTEAHSAAIPEEEPGNVNGRFNQEQIRLLVRQLFFPGSSKPPHHVVFSAIEDSTYMAEICMDVARTLAAQVSGRVCVIEANSHNPELERVFGREGDTSVSGRETFGFLRNSAQFMSGNLWLAPQRLLMGSTEDGRSSGWLERRLSDFRQEFDYTLLHAPAVIGHSEAALLARLSDGVALVLEANCTRRAGALKAKEILQSSHARILGTVLSERTFPIPQGIYRRL